MPFRAKRQKPYHHGDLATALLQAVEDLATKFGVEAVSLRACAKALGVSPTAAFRHYADKRALLTAFVAKALGQMAETMQTAQSQAMDQNKDPFMAVGLAYIDFALEKPAMFQLMWRRDLIDEADDALIAARGALRGLLSTGFAHTLADEDPEAMSAGELLAWASVHGLANLMVEGPVGRTLSLSEKQAMAQEMLVALRPALSPQRPQQIAADNMALNF